MNIKLDENLPLQLATRLNDLGYDADTAHDEGLTGHSNRDIWEAAQRQSRFLITQDLDFSDSRKFTPGSHHGILLLRLHFPNRRSLVGRVLQIFQKESVGEWSGCFVVAAERKVRVLKPPSKSGP